MSEKSRFGVSEAKNNLTCGDCRGVIAWREAFYFDNDRKGPRGFGRMICVLCKERIEQGHPPNTAAANAEPSQAAGGNNQYGEKLSDRLNRMEAELKQMRADIDATLGMMQPKLPPDTDIHAKMRADAQADVKRLSPAATLAGKVVEVDESEIPF